MKAIKSFLAAAAIAGVALTSTQAMAQNTFQFQVPVAGLDV